MKTQQEQQMNDHRRPMRVMCSACQEFHQVKDVKFIDIQEDYAGRDLMTFECSVTSTQQKAYVLG
jgi:hypothetical protein